MRPLSLPSFLAGAAVALTLAALPATAVLQRASVDAHPDTFDATTPGLAVQPVQFVISASTDAATDPDVNFCTAPNQAIPLLLRWSGSDSISGLAGFDVWEGGRNVGGEEEQVHGTSATSFRFTGGNYGSDCGGGDTDDEFWVVARDNRGNSAASARATQWVDVWQENGDNPQNGTNLSRTGKTGTWTTSNCTCFNGGHTLYSTVKGASLSYQVTTRRPGQTLGLVMEKNTNRGTVDVSVDGATASAVDTHASTANHRVIVWQKTLSVGTHTFKLTNAGTAGHSRIDLDSILLTP